LSYLPPGCFLERRAWPCQKYCRLRELFLFLRQELEHWQFLDSWSVFLPWKDEKHFQLTVLSDASGSGLGGVLRLPDHPQREIHGHWDLHQGDLPIIVKEAMALLFVLQKVTRLVLNNRVDYFVHNVPLVACWKKDGSRNAHVNTLFLKKYSTSLYPLTSRSLSLNFVPSDENPADPPS